ncbi:MAG: ComEC/Rec2 family competence protein [Candidatus Gracilibacteria bacterium]
MLSKNTFFNFFLTSFIITILVNNYLQDFLFTTICLLLFSVIYINLILYKKHFKKYIIVLLFIIIGGICGLLISNSHLSRIKENEVFLEKYYLRNYNYELEVKQLYKKSENYNSYIVKIDRIDGINVDKKLYGIVYVSNNLLLEKGNILSTDSQILNIDNVDSIDNYKNFLLSKNVYFKSYIFNFKVIKKIDNIFVSADKFRTKILNIINKIYPEEEGIFLSGILIGARENIPKELSYDFNNSGTTHMVAVSGFNITILIIFLGYLFKFIPVFLRTILIITFLVLFCIFVGLEASVIRAGIMGILGYMLTIMGRNNNSLTILLLTLFSMILYNPFYINYDISFQLSFLAVLGILYTKEFFDKVFKFLPNILAVKESFIITLSAMVLTLPISIFNFGQIPLLTPISNILISWNIPIIMLIGFISIILYIFVPILGIGVGFFSFILLKWNIFIIHFFGGLDDFVIKTDFGNYAFYLEILYFIVLVFLILNRKKVGN